MTKHIAISFLYSIVEETDRVTAVLNLDNFKVKTSDRFTNTTRVLEVSDEKGPVVLIDCSGYNVAIPIFETKYHWIDNAAIYTVEKYACTTPVSWYEYTKKLMDTSSPDMSKNIKILKEEYLQNEKMKIFTDAYHGRSMGGCFMNKLYVDDYWERNKCKYNDDIGRVKGIELTKMLGFSIEDLRLLFGKVLLVGEITHHGRSGKTSALFNTSKIYGRVYEQDRS